MALPAEPPRGTAYVLSGANHPGNKDRNALAVLGMPIRPLSTSLLPAPHYNLENISQFNISKRF